MSAFHRSGLSWLMAKVVVPQCLELEMKSVRGIYYDFWSLVSQRIFHVNKTASPDHASRESRQRRKLQCVLNPFTQTSS